MNMNCKMVTDIAELYYDNSLSPETKKAIRSHLRGCQNCRNYYRQYQAIRNAADYLRMLIGGNNPDQAAVMSAMTTLMQAMAGIY